MSLAKLYRITCDGCQLQVPAAAQASPRLARQMAKRDYGFIRTARGEVQTDLPWPEPPLDLCTPCAKQRNIDPATRNAKARRLAAALKNGD